MEYAERLKQVGGVLTQVRFDDLPGHQSENWLESFKVFLNSSTSIVGNVRSLREAQSPSASFLAVCQQAMSRTITSERDARSFFESQFVPFWIQTPTGTTGFVTGYYEPVVDADFERTTQFTEPVYGLPNDLLSLPLNLRHGPDHDTGGRMENGTLVPYPDRAEIYAGALRDKAAVLLWVRDKIELFMMQVQGSAKVRLPGGQLGRLVYAGRNGRPYSSIGRELVESGAIRSEDMSLATLKAWVREAGQEEGQAGRDLLEKNASYVFFKLERYASPDDEPIGGQGVPLSRLRSIATDRTIWAYGLPFWIHAELPWQGSEPSTFARMMISQDTGSAILGPARADIFFGSGDEAGARAGDIRHKADIFVLLPRSGAR